MNGLSFGRTVIVLVGIYFLRTSSKILRKLEYTLLILSELKTRSSQFVIFSSSRSLEKFREIRNKVIDLVRKAKDEYKNKLTSELLNKDIPPGKWWRIAKSISNFTKARDPPSNLGLTPSGPAGLFTFKIFNWSKISCSVMINSFK
jgi:hypothetical protein